MARPSNVPPLPTFGGTKNRRRLGPVCLRSFFRIMEKWQIGSEQAAALLAIDIATLEHWRVDPEQTLSREVLERLSLILGIYATLHAALPGELADIWISLPSDHPHFGGRPALTAMIEDGLPFMYQVRFNLDAEVFGPYGVVS